MSYTDLYLGGDGGPLIVGGGNNHDKNNTHDLATAAAAATVFGVPFDATHSFRPGCRFGPHEIRKLYNNIEIFYPDLRVDLEEAHIKDLGDMVHTVSSADMLNMVHKVTGELVSQKQLPIILGGEHSITYGTYTAMPKKTGYVVFDAHYDLRDGFSGSKFSHASYLRRIIEDNPTKDAIEAILHVGARAFVKEELEFLMTHKIKTISDTQIRNGDAPQIIKDHISSFDQIYTSFDLDVVDPAYAPGVGNPEAVGITSRELFVMINALLDTKIIAADIVELNPYHDNSGATAALAAKIMGTIIAMSVAHNRTSRIF